MNKQTFIERILIEIDNMDRSFLSPNDVVKLENLESEIIKTKRIGKKVQEKIENSFNTIKNTYLRNIKIKNDFLKNEYLIEYKKTIESNKLYLSTPANFKEINDIIEENNYYTEEQLSEITNFFNEIKSGNFKDEFYKIKKINEYNALLAEQDNLSRQLGKYQITRLEKQDYESKLKLINEKIKRIEEENKFLNNKAIVYEISSQQEESKEIYDEDIIVDILTKKEEIDRFKEQKSEATSVLENIVSDIFAEDEEDEIDTKENLYRGSAYNNDDLS